MGKFVYPYPRPSVTVDIALVTQENRPRILLIQRKNDPYAGHWALPGGFIEMEETLEASARRELLEETGLKVGKLEQLHTFGDPGRDPRGRTISVVYYTTVNPAKLKPVGGDDAERAEWFFLDRPPRLAFDHKDVLKMVRQRTKAQR